jgi:hypothetical protein
VADSDGEVFAGLPVVTFTGEDVGDRAVAWRLHVPEDDEAEGAFPALLRRFLDTVPPASVQALVVSRWGYPWEHLPPVEPLCAAADRLTGLTALHLGDTYICYLQNPANPDRLLAAYSRLEDLSLCGVPDAKYWRRPLSHTALRRLTVKTAGLPGKVARAIGESDLPALEHLELWLGVREEYGGTTTVRDLAPVLAGMRWPRLRYLGLRNAEHADEVAAAVATAPVVARLSAVDLSHGTLGDEGAEALLNGQSLTHLDLLDLRYHFVSKARRARLREVLGDRVDLDKWQDASREGRRFTRVRREEIVFRPTW